MLVLPEAWLGLLKGKDVFTALFALEGKVYREKEGRKTIRFKFLGDRYFAKLHLGIGWKEIIRSLVQLRSPVLSAENEWRTIQRLQQLGIDTPPLVGYGKKGLNPARLRSFLITKEIPNTASLEDFCRDWPTSPPSHAIKRSLIYRVAVIARTLHENGMNHRDFYICHFLLDVPSGREPLNPRRLKLYLIDLHRAQIRRRTPQRWRVKDISALFFSSMDIGLTKRDLLRFIRIYQNKPLRVSLRENRRFWQRVKNRAVLLYRDFHQKEPQEPL